MKMKLARLLAASATALAGLAIGGTASAAIRTLHPTGGAADLANVRDVILASSPGDTIILKARSLSGQITPFNFTTMASGGAAVVDVDRLIIQGEIESKKDRIVTRILGPLTFANPGSYNAFDVRANEVEFKWILFDTFEAAIVVRPNMSKTIVQEIGTIDCAYGIYGYGNNDQLLVKRCRMNIAGTSVGGNAAVTIQEGSQNCRVYENVFKGPGTELTVAAVIGVLEFNLDSPGGGTIVSDNLIRKFDAGIFMTSSNCQISRNKVRLCFDGIDVVSEVSNGIFQGSQTVVNVLVADNDSIYHTDDGVNLVGVQDSSIVRNMVSPNGDYGIDCDESVMGTTSTGNTLSGNVGTTSCSSLPLEESGTERRSAVPVADPIEP